MSEKKYCLVANQAAPFSEFHANLLQACQSCGLAIEEELRPHQIVERLQEKKDEAALLVIDLELLPQFSAEDVEKLRGLLSRNRIPALGLGFYEEEAASACRQHGLRHFLLKYQDPGQILCLLRALTFAKQGDERRRHSRHLVSLPAQYRLQGEVYRGEVQNISAAGLFIKTYEIPDNPGEIMVEIRLPNQSQPISCVCQICHAHRKPLGDLSPEAPGLGLRFLRLAETSARELEKFLRRLLEGETSKPSA